MSEKLKWKNTGGNLTLGGRQIKRGEIFEAGEAEVPQAFRDLIKPLASLPKESPQTFKHRRYAEGANPEYDLAFEMRFNASQIMNPKGRSYMDPQAWAMATLAGMRGVLLELEGQAERIAALLDSIGQEFERRKVQCRREGRPEPETLSPALLEEKSKAEARADVTAEEIDFIRGIIAKREALEKAEDEAKYLLPRGPIGAGKLRDGVLSEIDGQPVKPDKDGFLRIDCKKSLYNGMKIEDYRRLVCEPFLKWQRQPRTQAEIDLGPHRPPKAVGDPANWPVRPKEGV